MKTIKFSMETITPMFLGGADVKNAELRPPSVKGLMRYWWRAVNGSDDIDDLQKRESRIFGGGGLVANRSSFSIKIDNISIKSPAPKSFPNHPVFVKKITDRGGSTKEIKINILDYLAYGTYEYVRGTGNQFIRDYFPVESKFDIFIIIRRETYLKDVLLSMYLLSTFGGFGSRSRNGFGDFNIINRDVFSPLGDEYVKNLIPNKVMLEKHLHSADRLSYSAFTKGVKLFKTNDTFRTWDECLAGIGKIYKECRSSLENKHTYKKRQYLGAPLDPPRENFKSILDRHSKPYFMRVIKEGNNMFRGCILYLPSKYCEGLEKDRFGKSINHNLENENFDKVCKEFNKLLSGKMETIL